MQYGICNLTLVPMRSEPTHKSEMLNQMLFGEIYTINEVFDSWYKISLQHDNYEGWISSLSHTPLSKSDFDSLSNEKISVYGNILSKITDSQNFNSQFIVAASLLYKLQNNIFYSGSKRFIINNEETPYIINDKKIDICDAAEMFLSAPYLWGGRSVLGIDCSGLVQIAARLVSINLPRDANQQVHSGKTIDFFSESKRGDIAFFEDNEGNIVHTGIIKGNGEIIHAHTFVRIDGIDHNGIFNRETCVYSHKLRIIKRIL